MKERDPQPPEIENSPQTPPASESLSREEQLAKLEEEKRILIEQLKKLEAEKQAQFEQLVRRQADFENFRKRLERQQQEFRQSAEADLVAALLPVLDAFERALAAPASAGEEEYRKGVELIYKQLFDLLHRAGLRRVEALGKPFDPFLHDAVERVESPEHDDQQVVAELQRGYLFQQRLLRPALVRVAVRPRESEAPEKVN